MNVPLSLEEQIRLIAKIKKELQEKYTATLFSLGISGAHLYGFESKDSDVDLRGFFVVNSHKFLGLQRPEETIEMKIGNYDIVLHEIGKATALALKSNCNLLEEISAPQIYTSPDFLEWKNLVLSKISKSGMYNSYKGLSVFNYHKFIKTGRKKTVKKYLYVFRGLLAGIHVLESNILQPNIKDLAKYFKIPEVKTLIRIKIKGQEEGELPKFVNEPKLDGIIVKLFDRIDRAYTKSSLPEKPSEDDIEEVNSFLIKLRKKHLT